MSADIETQIEMRTPEEVDDYRHANDLDPLVFDEALVSVDRDHSPDLNDRDYFRYFSSDGDGPGDRLDDGGIVCSGWAENIASEYDLSFSEADANSVAEDIVNEWFKSPGH